MRELPTNLIARLRETGEEHPRDLAAALGAAARQARLLLDLTETTEPPVDPAILLAEPKVEIHYTRAIPNVSGACRWVGSRYVIAVNAAEPTPRQRFTIFHEFKHAVDGADTTAAVARFTRSGRRPAHEFVADYFAASVLMPVEWVAAAVRHAESLEHLADYFAVSSEAMRVRLAEQLGVGPDLVGAKL